MKKFAGDVIILSKCTKNHNIWCMVPEIQSETDIIFVILGNFFPFYQPLIPSNDPKNQNFEKKWKKCLEILSFYTYVCTINEDHMIYGSWNITCNRHKFSSFWAISYPFSPLTTWKINLLPLKTTTPGDIIILHICTINDNHMMYGSWDIWSATAIIFCNSGLFLLFYPPMDQENQNFENMKKTPLDIVIFQTCTIDDSHMMHGSWDMECNRQNIFVILDCFLHFTPLTTPKNQNFEKLKKPPGDIIISHMFTINDNHIMYGSWDTKCARQNFLSFWVIFCPFTPLITQKIKILKRRKRTPGDITILNIFTMNNNHTMYGFWDIEHDGDNFLSFWTIFVLLPP